jgi:hypothetical protein
VLRSGELLAEICLIEWLSYYKLIRYPLRDQLFNHLAAELRELFEAATVEVG